MCSREPEHLFLLKSGLCCERGAMRSRGDTKSRIFDVYEGEFDFIFVMAHIRRVTCEACAPTDKSSSMSTPPVPRVDS
jgi:hypothetical protein